MNKPQRLWWEQTKSDHEVFILIRSTGLARCQALHYLQMVTEKIGKPYLWRLGTAPPKSHAGFVQFLRFLGQIRQSDRERVAEIFSFKRFSDFQKWIRTILPIAYELERIAPDLAADGPNPEYPWPHDQPTVAPVHHDFKVWNTLMSGPGRDLLRIIQIAVDRFAEYADT